MKSDKSDGLAQSNGTRVKRPATEFRIRAGQMIFFDGCPQPRLYNARAGRYAVDGAVLDIQEATSNIFKLLIANVFRLCWFDFFAHFVSLLIV